MSHEHQKTLKWMPAQKIQIHLEEVKAASPHLYARKILIDIPCRFQTCKCLYPWRIGSEFIADEFVSRIAEVGEFRNSVASAPSCTVAQDSLVIQSSHVVGYVVSSGNVAEPATPKIL